MPRDILRHYSIRPKKKFGQSFLLEPAIIKKIVEMANVGRDDIVVEIGAGNGVLTEHLAQTAAKVIAVELDDRLVTVLDERLSQYHNVQIHRGNVLKFDFRALADRENTKIRIVGNIPYNISSPLIFYLLSFKDVITSFTLMMQKEFVDRLIACPGTKSYGVPSVILQMFSSLEKVMDIQAKYFYPRPKVESSLIRGCFLAKSRIELGDEDLFIKLVRVSFAQRRKMLINNLKQSILMSEMEESLLRQILISLNIDGRRRGETLSIEEFGNLSNALKEKIQMTKP